MPPFGRESVLLEYGAQQRLELGHRARRDDQPMAECVCHVGRVVYEVVRPRRMSAVVEELDAQVPIEREHPVAHLMDLVNKRPVLRRQRQGHDRPKVESALTSRHSRRRARHRRRQAAEKVGQLLRPLNRLSDTVSRQAPPSDGELVLVVLDRKILH